MVSAGHPETLLNKEIFAFCFEMSLFLSCGGGVKLPYIITCSLRCLPERVTTTDKCISESGPSVANALFPLTTREIPWILSCLPLGTALKSPESQVKHPSVPS